MFIGQAKDLLNQEIVGSFGNFKTQDSQELYYLMATLRLEQLDWLHTASESMDFNSVSFEEMVQRDIDYERVDNKIIKQYLQNGKGRVIFFPPLLISLMSFENNEPIAQYKEINDGISSPGSDNVRYYYKEWGKNYFKLELPLSEHVDTGYEIYCEKDERKYNYFNHAGTLKYNPNSTKLVVIDGQHRLSALKRIKDKSLLNGLKIPVCIFFSPNIVEGQDEHAKDSMRELFVTINNTSKEVGGHFLTLLNDNSLSAITVRRLAAHWKKITSPINFLHFIEWNQRESRLSSQVMRPYAITTVSIIDSAIKKYVLGDSQISCLLNLQSISEDLEKLGDPNIREDSFDKNQLELLSTQIADYLVEALHILLTKLFPYQVRINQVSSSYKKLTQKVEEKVHGAETYLNNVLMQFRVTTKYDDENVRDIERAFLDDIKANKEINEHDFYFRNVFQKGLIKAWSDLVMDLTVTYELSPKIIADAFIKGLNVGLADSAVNLFDNQQVYIQYSLYNGARILVRDQAVDQISYLLIAALSKGDALNAFVDDLGLDAPEKKDARDRLKVIVSSAKTDYLEAHNENVERKLKKDFRFMDLEEREIAELDMLQRKARAGDSESEKQFSEKIGKKAIDFKNLATKALESVLNSKK